MLTVVKSPAPPNALLVPEELNRADLGFLVPLLGPVPLRDADEWNQREFVIRGLIPGADTVITETRASREAQPRAVDSVLMSLTE